MIEYLFLVTVFIFSHESIHPKFYSPIGAQSQNDIQNRPRMSQSDNAE